MVKHDRYMVEPNQSCVVFAKETSLPLLGTSPMGPKGKFGMRLAGLQDEKFTIRYNHPPYPPLHSFSLSFFSSYI